jgi:hypothetical protein
MTECTSVIIRPTIVRRFKSHKSEDRVHWLDSRANICQKFEVLHVRRQRSLAGQSCQHEWQSCMAARKAAMGAFEARPIELIMLS